MAGLIQVPSWPGRGVAAQARITWLKATSAVTSQWLARSWGWELIDAQVENPHLLRMGAVHLPRAVFLDQVRQAVRREGREGAWTQAVGRLPAKRLAEG